LILPEFVLESQVINAHQLRAPVVAAYALQMLDALPTTLYMNQLRQPGIEPPQSPNTLVNDLVACFPGLDLILQVEEDRALFFKLIAVEFNFSISVAYLSTSI
jgi:hypothetical protein